MYSPGVLNWGCLCRVTKCHDRGLSSCLEISGRGIWGLIALGHPRALSYIIMNRDVRRIRKHQAKSPVHISEQKHGRLSNHSTGIHPRSTVPAAWYQEPVEALRASEDLPGESRGPVRSLPLDQPAVATWEPLGTWRNLAPQLRGGTCLEPTARVQSIVKGASCKATTPDKI